MKNADGLQLLEDLSGQPTLVVYDLLYSRQFLDLEALGSEHDLKTSASGELVRSGGARIIAFGCYS